MWFFDYILYWLREIRDRLYNAYSVVYNWYYPFWYLATPIHSIYLAFYYLVIYFGYFDSWVTYVNNKLAQVWTLQSVLNYLQTTINYAMWAWQWVANATYNVTKIFMARWADVMAAVDARLASLSAFVDGQIRYLRGEFTNLQTIVAEFLSKLPSLSEILSWFTNWWANIRAPLETWWNEKLLDIKSLIQSELRDWFPFYDDLTGLWSNIVEFFTDPEEWLYKAVDRIIERFW